MKSVIILGGGSSVKEGIEKGLWEKIKDKEVWSLNYCFKAMPFLPKKQLWVDIDFFTKELDNLQNLYRQGVELITRDHLKFAYIQEIKRFNTTRELVKYHGKQSLAKNEIFYGSMGLVGMFALTYSICLGYKNIYLLGYDFGSPSINHKLTHWYQEEAAKLQIHSSGLGRPEVYIQKQDGSINRFVEEFNVYKQETDVNIYNVSKISHITAFNKIDYNEFFNILDNERII